MFSEPSRSIFSFGGNNSSGSGLGNDFKFISTPSNLWSQDGLETLYGTEYLKNNFDHNFLKMAEEFSHPRRYLPPDINIIKKFCNECHDLNILTQSMNLQANKTKQIH
jgi:hypothetical protein